jgi:TIR domain
VQDDPRLDPADPVFFVSYSGADLRDASTDRTDSRIHVERFFNDLSANVYELLPLSTGHVPGFLDSQMRGGERWEAQILHAVGRCQVFVPLLSARFLTSRWCRFEWDAFSRRTVRRRDGEPHADGSGAQAAIVPVSWTGLGTARLPPVVSGIQAFSPGPRDQAVRDAYRQDGVLGLLKMKMEEDYAVVAWRLARRIVDIVQELEVVPEVPPDTSGLGTSFREDS